MQKRLTMIGVASVRGTFAASRYFFSKPNGWGRRYQAAAEPARR